MDNEKFLNRAMQLVNDYTRANIDKSVGPVPALDSKPFVVWSVKVLKNNKALLSTPLADGMYYEVTYDGNRDKIYFDAYKKWENIEYDAEAN